MHPQCGVDRGFRNDLCILRPEILQPGRADSASRVRYGSEHRLGRPRRLPGSSTDHTGTHDDGMVEVQRQDILLDLALHAHIAEHALGIGTGGADENIRLDARFFGRAGQLAVEFALERVLGGEATGVGPCGGEAGEENGRGWAEGDDVGTPLFEVGVDEGTEDIGGWGCRFGWAAG
jgi:hypothetical protein